MAGISHHVIKYAPPRVLIVGGETCLMLQSILKAVTIEYCAQNHIIVLLFALPSLNDSLQNLLNVSNLNRNLKKGFFLKTFIMQAATLVSNTDE